jgi:hypothetical protein
MSQPQFQPDPQPEPQSQPETMETASPQPVAQTKSRVRWIIAGVAVLVLLLCFGGCGALLATTNGDDKTNQGKAATSAAPTSPSATSAPTTAAAPASTAPVVATYDTPTKNDFKLKVKILRKKCFGSAGCNVTYRIDVTYTGSGLDPSIRYEVTYEVKGGEDPNVNTFEVTGDSASVQQEESTSTKRSGDKLTAVATSVSEL